MANLGISLVDVPSVVGCAKHGCSCNSHALLQRHHRSHEAMWIGIWAKRRRGETRFEALKKRYHEFRPEDVVLVCNVHHPEIHQIYDEIIRRHKFSLEKGLSQYTWAEADILMALLRKACDEWLTTETPGIESEELNRQRRARAGEALRKRLGSADDSRPKT